MLGFELCNWACQSLDRDTSLNVRTLGERTGREACTASTQAPRLKFHHLEQRPETIT